MLASTAAIGILKRQRTNLRLRDEVYDGTNDSENGKATSGVDVRKQILDAAR